ncbi:putative transferase CAF17 homolog, mitochondrial [Onthophagus taurus]|uniref:putative transferase CAF17 homolog, mitochondrial n=1 Tax=Onthophagus taurus TaxID=166361 RepID=UPI0039BE22B7
MNRLMKFSHLVKRYSTNISTKVIEKLSNRTILRISGSEVDDYVQGLITNDINHLKYGGSMYTFFLNTKGRVMYDAIVYKSHENDTYLIECDLNESEKLLKHLKMYKLRKKVDVVSLKDELDVYAMYDPTNIAIKKESVITDGLEGLIAPCDVLAESFPKESKTMTVFRDLYIYRDPRMFMLGSRIICPQHIDINQQITQIHPVSFSTEKNNYKWFRYLLGVGEGVEDLPPGNCFPLEANCDYLHGVSFHKGCYIGQELTARTYHTGIVRKRLMPLYFTKIPTEVINNNNENIIFDNVNLGKLRGIEGNVGLALLRISKCLEIGDISIGDGLCYTSKPIWWPVELPKEKLSVQKND